LLVEEFECQRDEADEDVDERSIHVDNVVARFEENRVCYFGSRAFVSVSAHREIGHFIDVIREWIIDIGVSCACGVICVEGRA